MSQALDVKEFRLTGDPEDGNLTLCAKRYRPFGDHKAVDNSITLLLAHCANGHKEQWEPTLTHLFNLQRTTFRSGCYIGEAWALDLPNHVESAVINEDACLKRPDCVTPSSCGRAIRTLLLSGLLPKTDIVPIGHSAGAPSIILSTVQFSLSNLPYKSMILVEPALATPEAVAKNSGHPLWLATMIAFAQKRRDTWPSRADAMVWFKARQPWKGWDPHVLQIFMDYGLTDLPTVTYPDRTTGVTLSCTRVQEALSYDYREHIFTSLERLSQLCSSLHVHCIFGTNVPVSLQEAHADVTDEKRGRKMASISKVTNAGHLIPQEAPYRLACAIFNVLQQPDMYQSRL